MERTSQTSCRLSCKLSRCREYLLPCAAAFLQVHRLRGSLERACVERRAAVQAGEPSLVEVEEASSGVYSDSIHLALLACRVGVCDFHALAAGALVVSSPGSGDDAVVVLKDVDEVLVLFQNVLGLFQELVCLGWMSFLRSSRRCRWERQSSRSRRS